MKKIEERNEDTFTCKIVLNGANLFTNLPSGI